MRVDLNQMDKGVSRPFPTVLDIYKKQMAEAKGFGKRVVERNNIENTYLDLKKMLPEEFEITGWQLPGELEETTKEMIDEVKKRMDIKVNTGVKLHRRDFMVIYRYGDVEVTTANDGTVWFLDKSKEIHEWVRMKESGYPELPQD